MTAIHSKQALAPQFGKLTQVTVNKYGQSQSHGDYIKLVYQGKNENGTPYQGTVFHDQFYYIGEHQYQNGKKYRFDLSSPTPFQSYQADFPETSPEVLADMKHLRQIAKVALPRVKPLQEQLEKRLQKIVDQARKNQ